MDHNFNGERVAKLESAIFSMGKSIDEMKDTAKEQLKYTMDQRDLMVKNQEDVKNDITSMKVDIAAQSTTIKVIAWFLGIVCMPIILASVPVLLEYHFIYPGIKEAIEN